MSVSRADPTIMFSLCVDTVENHSSVSFLVIRFKNADINLWITDIHFHS